MNLSPTLGIDQQSNASRSLEAGSSPASPLAKRQRRLLIIACLWALLSTGGLVASRWIKSPEQLAAETKPPVATLLTAPVEHRVLIDTVVTRGAVAAQSIVESTPSSAFGADKIIVTRIQKGPGHSIRGGEVLLEISGRPLIALPGQVPAYRDLRKGHEGKDVAQLQRALRSVGFSPGRVSGIFNSATENAMRQFYASLGYGPATSGDAVTLPVSEVIFLPAFPARVKAISSGIGDEVQAPLVTISTGALGVSARINPVQAGLVRSGMRVTIDAELLGRSAPGSVTSVGEVTADRETGERYVPLLIIPSKPLESSFEGQEVQLRIEGASSGSPVLIVPVAAIYLGGDGRSYVGKLDARGREIRVPLLVGMTAAGFSQVSPEVGTLAPGDRVVVGR